ncbi:serine/threonine protein phosphatase [Rhodobacterales bacterium HKCCE3408]|nr:serine/threonine protein phosphatase [Rhodobacterales bacterium HKCCE3408]
MTLYAIGDIHGQLDLLKGAHDRVAADRAREGTEDAELIHIGDLVDRGPDSAGVVDYLAKLSAENARVIVLRGNHDHMFHEFLNGAPNSVTPRGTFHYLSSGIGGRTTLKSYSVKGMTDATLRARAVETVPKAHRDFLGGLPFQHRAGECLFVHAGIRPGIPLEDQNPLDLIWIRDEFLLDLSDHGFLVVHGHTPASHVEHWGNRVNIDTGAAYGGPVSAVAIEGRRVWLLTDDGREEIT